MMHRLSFAGVCAVAALFAVRLYTMDDPARAAEGQDTVIRLLTLALIVCLGAVFLTRPKPAEDGRKPQGDERT